MPLFPTFRRPCPYLADLAAVMDGAWCRMCGQQVHDITDWSDAERAALLRRCDEEVCVSYRVPAASALAAAALIASPVSAATKHHPHHRPQVAYPQPPVITLAGAPVPLPPEPHPQPTSTGGDQVPPKQPGAPVDPQSSR